MTTTIALYRRTNAAADTATFVRDGGDVRATLVADGVTEEQTFSGLEYEAEEWLRTTVIDYRADGWEAVDGAYLINGRHAWQHVPCGKGSETTWASPVEAVKDYAAHDAKCTNYGYND